MAYDNSPGTVTPLNTATGAVGSTIAAGDNPIAIAISYVAPPPAVTAVAPDNGTTAGGTAITITGTGFIGATAADIGGSNACTTDFTVVNATSITCDSRTGSAGTVDVTVTTPQGTSSTNRPGDEFTYEGAPTVTGVAPDNGITAGGTALTITGTGFIGATAADIGPANACTSGFTVVSVTSITCDTPAGPAGTVDVRVTTPQGTSPTNRPGDEFTYEGAPTVTGVAPDNGITAGGTALTITGTGFIGATAADIGPANACTSGFTVVSVTSITCDTPAGPAGTVDVRVTTPQGTSPTNRPGDEFTYEGAPTVTGVAPDNGSTAGGTALTITGTGFIGATAADIGPANACTSAFTVVSVTSITCTTPPGAGTVEVTVTAPQATSATNPPGDQFTYLSVSPTAYVANYSDNTVTPIDTATDTAGPPIAVGNSPDAIAITPGASTAYVANSGDNTVTPIDTTTNTPGAPIAVGSSPDAIAITPDGATAYVANSGDNTVTPIDTATNTPGAPIAVGSSPDAIAITPDGATAYVANFGDNTVTPIDTATNTPGPPISAGNTPSAIAITPGGATAYVANWGSNTDTPVDDTVTPIDTATNSPGPAIAVGNYASAIAITPDGATAYVANQGDGTVTPIDTDANTAGAPIPVGNSPDAVAIAPDGSTAYVVNSGDDTVTPIDTDTDTADSVIPVGDAPGAIAISYVPPRPTVTGVTPDNGSTAGGTAVTITGTGFIGATAADIGGSNACTSDFTVVNSTEITCTTPPGAGTVDVTMTTSQATSALNVPGDEFNYEGAPTVTGVAPDNGSTSGGTARHHHRHRLYRGYRRRHRRQQRLHQRLHRGERHLDHL